MGRFGQRDAGLRLSGRRSAQHDLGVARPAQEIDQPPRLDAFAVLGLPLTEITGTISSILITVALVTAGGLLLLSSIIAIVIRIGLGPLRAVAAPAPRVAEGMRIA